MLDSEDASAPADEWPDDLLGVSCPAEVVVARLAADEEIYRGYLLGHLGRTSERFVRHEQLDARCRPYRRGCAANSDFRACRDGKG